MNIFVPFEIVRENCKHRSIKEGFCSETKRFCLASNCPVYGKYPFDCNVEDTCAIGDIDIKQCLKTTYSKDDRVLMNEQPYRVKIDLKWYRVDGTITLHQNFIHLAKK